MQVSPEAGPGQGVSQGEGPASETSPAYNYSLFGARRSGCKTSGESWRSQPADAERQEEEDRDVA